MELYIPCRHLEVEPSLQHLHLLWLVSGARGTGLLAYTLVFCSLDKMQPPAGCTLPGAGSRKQEASSPSGTVRPHSEHSRTTHLQWKAKDVGVQRTEIEPNCVGRLPALDQRL